jgi:hypothetical protein
VTCLASTVHLPNILGPQAKLAQTDYNLQALKTSKRLCRREYHTQEIEPLTVPDRKGKRERRQLRLIVSGVEGEKQNNAMSMGGGEAGSWKRQRASTLRFERRTVVCGDAGEGLGPTKLP